MVQGITSFQNKILSLELRDLPWRNTTDPYAILVSEIMLQQTQVDRVIPRFERWLKRWPTAEKLAKADRKDVLKEWMGLGYNNRAIRLHEAAKKIVSEYGGDVVAAMDDYKNIPGVGPYTAAAIRIFSANEDIVTVDTNIRRIFIHEFNLSEDVSDKELWELAERCLPRGKSRHWHNALMDYGALHLTARKTGIKPRTRQSKFEGSDRQIRAKVLRHVLREGEKTVVQLQEELDVEKKRLEKILEGMEKDGLITKEGKTYSVA